MYVCILLPAMDVLVMVDFGVIFVVVIVVGINDCCCCRCFVAGE